MDDSLIVPGLFRQSPSEPIFESPTLRERSDTASSTGYSTYDSESIQDGDHGPSAASTLRFILASSGSPPFGLSHHDRRLIEAFQNASGWDKAFVTSVAERSKDLQDWCEELERWPWNGRFDDAEESNRDVLQQSDSDILKHDIQMSATIPCTGNSGGLSTLQISMCGARLQEIKAELGNIDIREMKSRALTTRLHGNDLLLEAHASPHARLDVLSALVTVTILEALPFYSRVTFLTQQWAARLSIVELIPSFSSDVEQVKMALDSAWQCVEDEVVTLSDARFEELQPYLEEKVAWLGQTIDFMLDTLEGLDDTVPEQWVDLVEALEVDYAAWTVAARKVLLKHLEDAEPANNLTHADASLDQQITSELGDHQIRDVPERNTDASHEAANDQDTTEYRAATSATKIRSAHSKNPSLVLPADLDITLSRPSNLPVYQSLAQSFTEPSQQNTDLQRSDSLRGPLHLRGTSLESVDSQIANPDGSPRFPTHWQSIYRKAATAAIGTVNASEIRSVHLRRNTPPNLNLKNEWDAEQTNGSSSHRDLVQLPQDYILSQPSYSGGIQEPSTPPSTNGIEINGENLVQASLREPLTGVRDDLLESLLAEETAKFGDEKMSTVKSAGKRPAIPAGQKNVAQRTLSTSPTISRDFALPNDDMNAPETSEMATKIPNRPPQFSLLPVSTDDQLDKKIDRILTTLPQNIKFNRRTSSDFGRKQARWQLSGNSDGSGLRSPTPTSERAAGPSAINPAERRDPRAPKQSGDSAIKIYQLFQEGRTHPIKLYVRLLGENGEKVMVRVGGGWADLGEYLREYASHHSRMVVPEANAPQQAIDLDKKGNTRVFSLPAKTSDAASRTPSPSPPSPTHSTRSSLPNQRLPSTIPTDSLSISNTRFRPADPIQKTKSLQALISPASQPLSEEDASSPMSAADPADEDVNSDDDVSNARKKLSEEKKQWLQDMVSKAKKWKAEGGGAAVQNQNTSLVLKFGLEDMGSVGSTKRVFRVQS